MKLKMTHYEWLESYVDMSIKRIQELEEVGYSAAALVAAVVVLSDNEKNCEYEHAYKEYASVLKSIHGQEALDDTGHLSTMANLVMHVASLRFSGEQIFCLNKNLTWCLAKTDLNIPENLVVPPYKSFYISFDEPIFDGEMYHNGVYVKTDELEDGRLLRVMTDTTRVGGRYNIVDSQYNFYRIEIDNMSEGILFSEILQRWSQSGTGEVNIDFATEIMSIVVNFILYISSSDIDSVKVPKTKKGKISKKKKKRAQRNNSMAVTAIGYTANFSYGESNGEGTKLKRQHIVRGHWRNQAYGEGRKLRKLIFIQPFIKGPDTGESLKRKYKVEV